MPASRTKNRKQSTAKTWQVRGLIRTWNEAGQHWKFNYPPSGSFTYFSKLPQELQDQIWTECLPGARNIILSAHITHKPIITTPSSYHIDNYNIRAAQNALPITLSICHSSRVFTQRIYGPRYSEFLQRNRPIYFNPRIDYLTFADTRAASTFISGMSATSQELTPRQLKTALFRMRSTVENIAIPIPPSLTLYQLIGNLFAVRKLLLLKGAPKPADWTREVMINAETREKKDMTEAEVLTESWERFERAWAERRKKEGWAFHKGKQPSLYSTLPEKEFKMWFLDTEKFLGGGNIDDFIEGMMAETSQRGEGEGKPTYVEEEPEIRIPNGGSEQSCCERADYDYDYDLDERPTRRKNRNRLVRDEVDGNWMTIGQHEDAAAGRARKLQRYAYLHGPPNAE